MRAILCGLLASVVGVSIASGCVSWSDPTEVDETPTPQCTPPTANSVDVDLLVADAFAFAGKPAAARFVLGSQVLSCTTAMVPAGGDFALYLDGFGPIGGAALELVLSTDADAAHSAGDLSQRFLLGVDGTVTPDAPCSVHEVWDVAFSVTGAASEAVTWALGTACPGS